MGEKKGEEAEREDETGWELTVGKRWWVKSVCNSSNQLIINSAIYQNNLGGHILLILVRKSNIIIFHRYWQYCLFDGSRFEWLDVCRI